MTSTREDEDWVYAQYVDRTGREHSIQSRFLVGADGKTGFTRKQYLEPRGIHLEQALHMPYEEDWVAMNWKVSLPTPETHPNFPLWRQGYTPQQVYDAFFPRSFRFVCDPERAAVCGRFGLAEDRLWRFEFVVLHGESPPEMATSQKMEEIVYPYITHPGKRYGLSVPEVQYPSDCIQVLRCRPFRFSARSCNKWSLGRVVLCGDAAHVFPPFGGQGIASGFRDAIALAWRLRLATQSMTTNGQGQNVDHRRLLQGWYMERKQQLDASLRSTLENGAYVTETSKLKVCLRDWHLWFLQLVPTWKHWLQLGNRRDGMVQYQWLNGQGMAFVPKHGGGGCFPQVYATRLGDEKVSFTDDIIFGGHKKGLFQLVIIIESLSGLDAVDATLKTVNKAAEGAMFSEEATVFIAGAGAEAQSVEERVVYRFATGEEFAMDADLCAGRPEPKGYDRYQMVKAAKGNKFILLRPDRFVFAACSTNEQLLEAVANLSDLVKVGTLQEK